MCLRGVFIEQTGLIYNHRFSMLIHLYAHFENEALSLNQDSLWAKVHAVYVVLSAVVSSLSFIFQLHFCFF